MNFQKLFILILALICHQFYLVNSASITQNGKKENEEMQLLENCPNKTGICRSYDKEKAKKGLVNEAKIKEEKAKFNAEFKKKKINFDIGQMDGMEKNVFSTFLSNPENEKQFLKVFKYLTQMKEKPICVTHTTIETIVKLVGQTEASAKDAVLSEGVKESARQSRELIEKQIEEKNNNYRGDAYLFGQEGVVEIIIEEDGYKCADSLLDPQGIVLFIQAIIKGLEQNKAKTFADTIESVIEYLDQHPITPTATTNSEVVKHSHGLKEKWNNTLAILKKKGVKEDLKEFAIWLVRPTHIDGLIQIILFITGMDAPVDLSLAVLQLFGIDQLFVKAIEKIGVKIEVATGIKPEVVMWAFGPNGVLPLFITSGDSGTEDAEAKYRELVDQAGQRHKVLKRGVKEEVEFLKHICIELIEHKGRPMHELMDNLLGNFKKMEAHIHKSWERHIHKWENKWNIVKSHMNAKDIRADLKKFAVWFVTPDRVNKMIQLILSATNLDTPVFLTLSLLEMFGITDKVLKELNLFEQKSEMSEFAKKHPHGEKAIQFMIGKDGIVPLFIQAGQLDEATWKEDKNEYAAGLIKIIGEVLINHGSPTLLVTQLFAFFLETVESREFHLLVVQKWNEWNENHHKKLEKAGIVPKKLENTTSKKNANGKENAMDKFLCLPMIWGWIRKTETEMKNKISHPKNSGKVFAENREFKCNAPPKPSKNICIVHSVDSEDGDGWDYVDELKGSIIKKQNSMGKNGHTENTNRELPVGHQILNKQHSIGQNPANQNVHVIKKQPSAVDHKNGNHQGGKPTLTKSKSGKQG